MKRTLGRQETQLLAWLQMKKKRTVRTGELRGPLRLTMLQERELLRRMAGGGLIARVRPGLFLVPAQLPLGGAWSPDEALALNTLMADRGGRYQICGPNAFHRYGFEDQVPVRVYAYNDKVSGERVIGSVELTMIKVDARRLGSVERVRTADGNTAIYSSRVRTLLDAVYDWSRFNGLPRAYSWIREDLRAERITPARLVTVTLRYGDLGTRRRIGLLLEGCGAPEAALRRLERSLTSSSSLIPWIPTNPKRGTVSNRWGVVVNGTV